MFNGAFDGASFSDVANGAGFSVFALGAYDTSTMPQRIANAIGGHQPRVEQRLPEYSQLLTAFPASLET